MTNVLKIGEKAPDFTLSDKDQKPVSLSQIGSAFKVVYFYPKDSTPGCTLQAQQFTKDLKKIRNLNAEVIGISGGDAKSKTNFCKKYKLTIPLVSDSDFAVAKLYGVYGEKFFMGRKYLGISRVTFLIGTGDRILKVYEKASPEENSSEIISELKKLQGLPSSKEQTSTSTKRASKSTGAKAASSTKKVLPKKPKSNSKAKISKST